MENSKLDTGDMINVQVLAAEPYLAKLDPRWYRKINPETLDMGGGNPTDYPEGPACVLEQVTGTFCEAYIQLVKLGYGGYGFRETGFHGYAFSSPALRDSWIKLAALRLAEEG